MENERDWGTSPVSHYLAEEIDTAMQIPDLNGREIASRNPISMILIQLCVGKVGMEALEHLKIDFVHQKSPGDTEILSNDEPLRQIQTILKEQFGNEVMSRMNLSLGDDKVRIIPH